MASNAAEVIVARSAFVFVAFFVAVFCVGVLDGCATAASREQLVSIDSSPRGASVVDDDGTVLGTTPVLLQQPRAAEQHYTVTFGDDDTQPVRLSCDARTGFLVADAIPALPLLVLPPPLNVVGYVAASATLAGIDSADGAIFECPSSLLVHHPDQAGHVAEGAAQIADVEIAALPAFAGEGCPRFVVVPPAATSEAESAAVVARITPALLSTTSCATVVDAGEGAAVFGRKRIAWHRPFVRARLTREHVHEIAFKTKATHVVEVEAADAEVEPTLRVIDVHTLQAARGPAVTTTMPAFDRNDDLFRWLLLYGVGLIPDTFVWNAAAKFFPFTPTTNERVVDQVFTNPFLATAINFQVYHLDNPEAHAPWDFTFTVGPDLLALLNGSRMTLEDPNGNQRTLTLNVIQAVVPISPRATFFTPAGVSAIWVGAGPALIIDWDEPNYDADWRLSAFVHAGISHSVFLTRTVFVGFGAHGNRSIWSHVQRDGVALDWFFQANINLGISFPDFTYDVADLL